MREKMKKFVVFYGSSEKLAFFVTGLLFGIFLDFVLHVPVQRERLNFRFLLYNSFTISWEGRG